MTFVNSTAGVTGNINGTEVQAPIAAEATANMVLIAHVTRTGTNSSTDFELSCSNGGEFEQIEPLDAEGAPGGMSSVGTVSKTATFKRLCRAGDAGALVTATSGSSGATGRWTMILSLRSSVDYGSVRALSSGGGGSTTYVGPALTPASGTDSGDIDRFYVGSASGTLGNFGDAPAGHTMRGAPVGTAGTTQQNLKAVHATAEFTGGGEVAGANILGPNTAHRRGVTVLTSGVLVPAITAVITQGDTLEVQKGSGSMSLSGTGELIGGATLTSRTWSVVGSGTTSEPLTLSGETTDLVTFTPPATPALPTTRLRYARAGSPGGLTAQDEIVITWTDAPIEPITAPVLDAVGRIVDASATPFPLTLTQTGGVPGTITALGDPADNRWFVVGEGTFELAGGGADPVTFTVAAPGADEGLLEILSGFDL